MKLNHSIEELKQSFEKALKILEFSNKPIELYEPINYLLSIGGKRARPVCTLAACELFGKHHSVAINQALAVEIFHNFTLAHDDIMDKADLRRGHETIHKKWNENVGILSGDAMMILAYQYLQKASSEKIHPLLANFNRTAIKICEGQQLDMNFETTREVSLEDYISMIKRKTAVLLGEAMRLGAIMADASEIDQQLIYDFGRDFGIAFQIQDDILDLYGDPKKFGKKVGGDVIAGKKTYLYLKALELAEPEMKDKIHDTYYSQELFEDEKIEAIQKFFNQLEIKSIAKAEMNRFYNSASIALNSINVDPERKAILKDFAAKMMVRDI